MRRADETDPGDADPIEIGPITDAALEAFGELCELDPSLQEQRLARLRRRDESLYRVVRGLLEGDRNADSRLDDCASGALGVRIGPARMDDEAALDLGSRIGPFVVERLIGRGGMGAVYEASRRDDEFDQRVAIKTIRRPLAALEALFRRERQVLARLDHPGIATLYDGGTLEQGMSYLVMEHIEGVPLDEHCAAEGLDLAARLRLFVQACEPVEHAHRNLVLHGDLKPTNILVTADGRCKLIDFGISRMIDESSQAWPSAVSYSLGYSSPEQIRGEELTTASEVFSMGAVLRDVLDGAPFRIPGEVHAIVAKATAPEATRRYSTVCELSEEVSRFLEGRVVRAHATGALAELRKWVARNRGFATAIAAAVLALVGGALAVALVQTEARQQQVLDSDLYRLGYLHEQEAGLWPRDAGARGEIDAWLRQARSVLSRKGAHEQRLEEARLAKDGSGAVRRQHEERVMDLLRGLSAEDGLVRAVERRVELADRAVTRYASEWSDAIASIERDEDRYAGLRIEPQLGFVPIGRDPASRLWEFAHLPTGSIPSRGSDGHLMLTAESALVFVLLPGGTFHLGAQSANVDGFNYADEALGDEGPVREVTLAPFLLSKYEMTQGQWLRITGENPSEHPSGRAHDGVEQTLLAPVEKVSWIECARALGRHGLVLPTEAQWEYAARAETASPWWTGSDALGLSGAANLADAAARRAHAPFPAFVPWDDGYPVTAPVDAFDANPFGLHDVHGNVWEWTRDVEGGYELPFELGDGLRPNPTGRDRVLRGGGCDSDASIARSAYRYYADEHHRDGFAGVRPAAVLRIATND